jgi:translation initiation factor 2B subunit (eIF-2B alpha/beta/delta family)
MKKLYKILLFPLLVNFSLQGNDIKTWRNKKEQQKQDKKDLKRSLQRNLNQRDWLDQAAPHLSSNEIIMMVLNSHDAQKALIIENRNRPLATKIYQKVLQQNAELQQSNEIEYFE